MDPQGFETSCRVAQSQVRCLSQLLRNLLQHLGGVAPPLSEHHLPLCHETAEILEFLECLFWCVGTREAIVNVKRFLDHGCSFRILVLVVICHLVEHSCGQEWRKGNAKSQLFILQLWSRLVSGSLARNLCMSQSLLSRAISRNIL